MDYYLRMIRMRPFRLLTVVLLAVPLAHAAADTRPLVMTSILPQSYFVQRVAGDRVRIAVLVGPGQSPHSYEPSPRQMADLAGAGLWLTIGVEFEQTLVAKARSLYPRLPIVDTTAGVAFRTLEAHLDEGVLEEGGRDTHTWLGRAPVKLMAATIRDALIRLDPAGADSYRANCAAFVRDVDAAFDGLVKELAPLRGKTAFVYHPAFGYFLDELGIAQKAVETGGKEPTQKVLADLVALARKDGAKVIFVQSQFPTSAAQTVAAAIGGTVVEMDDLAPDWLDNIKRMGEALRRSIP
jgi:zinc transport system substrate-binding protein